MFCEVIVDVANKQVNRTFDYLIPEELSQVILVGARVKVNFGPRIVVAFVVKVKEQTECDLKLIKPILEVLDINPPLNEEFVELAYQMSKYNFSFYASNLETMIPAALKIKVNKILTCIDKSKLSDSLRECFGNSNKISFDIHTQKYLREIKKQIEEKNITLSINLKNNATIKTNEYIFYVNDSIKANAGQRKILDYLKEIKGPVLKKILINDMGFSQSSLNTLIKNGNVKIETKDIYREISYLKTADKRVSLNEEQLAVINEVEKYKGKCHTFILKGVTGSGKTEVYMELIAKALKENLDSILLVPEIALTPQMTSRFKARFGDLVAVMHSGLSPLEKYDEWRKITNGDAKIAVGARSAIFAPFKHLGLIIIDEAHEDSYIQDNNPRYDASVVASMRSQRHSCPLILGSATPKVCQYYKALNNEATLLVMNKRANNLSLPKTKIVSLVDELKAGNRSSLSLELQKEIIENLKNDEQTILFLNRRGFSSFVQCRSCGETINCPHCDLALTYHQYGNLLKCHHCGYQTTFVRKCPSCGSQYIKEVGSGTQRIEAEVNRLFPQAKTIRMDNDTMSKACDYEDAFSKFKNKEANILIGTQMIAKGLDFENVTLVGILNADLALKYPVYDSNEICFDLIEQVSGRAGRGNKSGRVIIQTYSKDHYAITSAAAHNYELFYNKEIENRLISFNPPFSKLIEICIKSKEKIISYEEANKVRRYLDKNLDDSKIFGPSEANIFKENDYYNYLINIQTKSDCLNETLSFLVNEYQDNKKCNIDIKRR